MTIQAALTSTRDPKYTVIPQKERLRDAPTAPIKNPAIGDAELAVIGGPATPAFVTGSVVG